VAEGYEDDHCYDDEKYGDNDDGGGGSEQVSD
jgi:hypothetical protein